MYSTNNFLCFIYLSSKILKKYWPTTTSASVTRYQFRHLSFLFILLIFFYTNYRNLSHLSLQKFSIASKLSSYSWLCRSMKFKCYFKSCAYSMIRSISKDSWMLSLALYGKSSHRYLKTYPMYLIIDSEDPWIFFPFPRVKSGNSCLFTISKFKKY